MIVTSPLSSSLESRIFGGDWEFLSKETKLLVETVSILQHGS